MLIRWFKKAIKETLKRVYGDARSDSSRVYLERWLKETADSLPDGAMVLDAGSGKCEYRPLFSRARYESADFCKYDMSFANLITHVCDLTSIPVEDDRYDLVVCTQVLEHVPEPKAVLKELHRVLKPNAKLVLSAPLFYEEHGAPYDFYRYTQFGFRHLLGEAGFRIESMEWLEGYYGVLSYQLGIAVKSLQLKPEQYGGGVRGWAALPVIFMAKHFFRFLFFLFGALDITYKNTSVGQCMNYMIVAFKKDQGHGSVR